MNEKSGNLRVKSTWFQHYGLCSSVLALLFILHFSRVHSATQRSSRCSSPSVDYIENNKMVQYKFPVYLLAIIKSSIFGCVHRPTFFELFLDSIHISTYILIRWRRRRTRRRCDGWRSLGVVKKCMCSGWLCGCGRRWTRGGRLQDEFWVVERCWPRLKEHCGSMIPAMKIFCNRKDEIL